MQDHNSALFLYYCIQMKQFSLVALFSSYLLIIVFACYYPKWQKQGPEATISYDVSGYYLYLPALFIYKDIHHLNFYQGIEEKYNIPEIVSVTAPVSDGRYTMKYPAGAAVLYSPFFFIAHGIAQAGGYPADGYSFPYQVLLGIGSLLYAFFGIWILRKILLKYFNELITGITLLLIVAATNYLNYAAIDQAMAHNLLFTVYALIVWCTIQFYEKPNSRYALFLGLLCGIATIIRPTELICILIPLGWGVSGIKSAIARSRFFVKQFKLTITFIIAAVVIGSIQIIYWQVSTGHFLYYSYQQDGFSWLHPHLKDGLFSFRKGWFIYTPFMLCIIPGFYFLHKFHQKLFLPILIFTLLNIYIAFSWDIWWYGGSLGQRSMVQSYLLLSFPIASLVQAVIRSGMLYKIAFALIAAFCIWFNVILTLQAHHRSSIYESENMTKTYFLRTFGKLNLHWDSKKLLDTDENFNGKRDDIKEIYFNDMESDTARVDTMSRIGGKNCLFVNGQIQYTTPYAIPLPPEESKWIRISADFYFPEKEWNTWHMTQFIVQFKNNEEVVKSKFIRIQRIMSQQEIKRLDFDIQIPDEAYNKIEFYLWNAESEYAVYADHVRVEAFK